jgi:hypothetical protein
MSHWSHDEKIDDWIDTLFINVILMSEIIYIEVKNYMYK